MKTTMIALGLLTFASLLTPSNAQERGAAEDKQPDKPAKQDLTKLTPEQAEIRKNAEAFVQAFNKADAKAVAALHTSNAQMSIDGETIAEGRTAIEKAYADFFKENPGTQISVTIDAIKLLGPNLAVEKGTSQTNSGAEDAVDGYSLVHVKQGGKWLTATAEVIRRRIEPAFDWKKELAFLEGKWLAEKDDWRVETSIEWVAGGNFLKRTFEVTNDGKRESSGVQVIGWDPIDAAITSWTFSSEGGHGRGWWTRDDNHWVVQTEATTSDGDIVRSTNLFTLLGKDEFRWQSTDRNMNGVALEDTSSIRVRRVK